MNQRTICKTLAVAVIILFIGLGINPAIAKVEPETPVDDDCTLCPKVSSLHFVRIKDMLNRLEKYDTQLSILSKHIPEFKEKYLEVSDKVNALSETSEIYLSEQGWKTTITCTILGVVYGLLNLIWDFISSIFYSLPWPLDKISAIIIIILHFSVMCIVGIAHTMDCWWI